MKRWSEKYLERLGSQIISRKEQGIRTSAHLKKFASQLNARKPISEEWFKKSLYKFRLWNLNQARCYQNYPFKHFIIDFAYPAFLIAIEIDDTSHSAPERQFKDKVKDSFLKQEGWSIYRIPYLDEEALSKTVKYLQERKNTMDWRTLRRLTK